MVVCVQLRNFYFSSLLTPSNISGTEMSEEGDAKCRGTGHHSWKFRLLMSKKKGFGRGSRVCPKSSCSPTESYRCHFAQFPEGTLCFRSRHGVCYHLILKSTAPGLHSALCFQDVSHGTTHFTFVNLRVPTVSYRA